MNWPALGFVVSVLVFQSLFNHKNILIINYVGNVVTAYIVDTLMSSSPWIQNKVWNYCCLGNIFKVYMFWSTSALCERRCVESRRKSPTFRSQSYPSHHSLFQASSYRLAATSIPWMYYEVSCFFTDKDTEKFSLSNLPYFLKKLGSVSKRHFQNIRKIGKYESQRCYDKLFTYIISHSLSNIALTFK